jgi:hypothetical protein
MRAAPEVTKTFYKTKSPLQQKIGHLVLITNAFVEWMSLVLGAGDALGDRSASQAEEPCSSQLTRLSGNKPPEASNKAAPAP